MIFEQMDRIYPNYYAKRMVHWIGHFETLRGLGAPGTIILQLDVDGKIKHSYHNTDGSLSDISEAHWFDGALYLGSPFNTYVGRVKLSFADPQKIKPEQKPEQQKEQQSRKQQQKPPSQPQQQKSTQQQQQQQQQQKSQSPAATIK
jgi:hypothetical protein